MTSPAKKIVWHNAPLKVISFILGYTFWYIFSNAHMTTSWITIPLYFYNIPSHKKIIAPENLLVKVAGKRSELRCLDIKNFAAHIDAQKFLDGPNRITISDENLFLPENIKLIHYCPSNLSAELEQSNTNI